MVVSYSSEGALKDRIGCASQIFGQLEISISKNSTKGDRRTCYLSRIGFAGFRDPTFRSCFMVVAILLVIYIEIINILR